MSRFAGYVECAEPGCRSLTPEARPFVDGRCELHGEDGQEVRDAAHRGSQVVRLLGLDLCFDGIASGGAAVRIVNGALQWGMLAPFGQEK